MNIVKKWSQLSNLLNTLSRLHHTDMISLDVYREGSESTGICYSQVIISDPIIALMGESVHINSDF